jgi:hypothetical protein
MKGVRTLKSLKENTDEIQNAGTTETQRPQRCTEKCNLFGHGIKGVRTLKSLKENTDEIQNAGTTETQRPQRCTEK